EFARHGHCSLEYKKRLWIIGGWSEIKNRGLNDTLYSSDGINWHKIKKDGPWSGREDHTALVFKDKIWIFGGMADEGNRWVWKNDIWYSSF
ncbi:hypothetical protein H5T58_03735, partial [Candidatus Parcubacteria bacterium]|nr:hypothetical protein [Candidatus Parcubacteria bacterium]